jgi:outer membrane protein OmpA-like peptidoglycan-associated protein
MRLRVFAGLLLTTAGATPLAAQQGGAVEFGVYARQAWFGESYQLQNKGGMGARLGFFLHRNWQVEADASFVPTHTTEALSRKTSQLGLGGRLLYNAYFGEHSSLVLGGGYTYYRSGYDVDGNESGPGGLLGLRLGLGEITSIRLDGTIDYMPSPNVNLSIEDREWRYGFNAGISFLFGGRRSERAPAIQTEPAARQAQPDSAALAMQERMRADSVAAADRARQQQAQQDSIAAAAAAREQAQRDSVRLAEERAQNRMQALRDSLTEATRADSIRSQALRDSLRLVGTNRVRAASLRDSLRQMALRDSLRILVQNKQSSLTLQGVNFQINKAVLTPNSKFILEEVARSLLTNPDVTVEVAGHTDNTGSRALNERLSRERAESVKAYLIEQGVTAERMTTNGYAWDKPVASNKTVSGRAQNRRTELRRTD